MPGDTLDDVDPYSGISNRLLLLINDILGLRQESQMHSTALGDKVALATVQTKAQHMKSLLVALHQRLPEWILITDSSLAKNLQQTADAYQLAALILLDESFPSASTSKNADSQGLVSEADEKAKYIKDVLALVEKTLSHSEVTISWPLWPLFIAGCSCTDDEDKISVLELFDTAKRKSNLTVRTHLPLEYSLIMLNCLQNIAPALEIVQAVWAQRELAADEEVCARTLRRRRQQSRQ